MTLFRIAILWRIPLAVLLGAAFLGEACEVHAPCSFPPPVFRLITIRGVVGV